MLAVKKVALLGVGFAFATLVHAESGQPQSNINLNVQKYDNPYMGKQNLNDDVFNLPSQKGRTGVMKSPLTGKDRYSDDDEDEINSAQRKSLLKKCARWKEKDGEKWRECFEQGKKEIVEGVEQNRQTVERRSSAPLRNYQSIPKPDVDGLGGMDEKE